MSKKLAITTALFVILQMAAIAASFETDEYFSITYSSASLRQKSGLSRISLSTSFSETTFGHKLFNLEIDVYFDQGRPYSVSLTIRPAHGFEFPNDRTLEVRTTDNVLVLEQPPAFDLLLFESQDRVSIERIVSATSIQFIDANDNSFLIAPVQWNLIRSVIEGVIHGPNQR